MALTLEQYGAFLSQRKDILFPAAPTPVPLKAKPHVKRIEGLRGIFWNLYGTLLLIAEGDLKFESTNDFMMNVALDKTIQEFKMWASMSRKPGQSADYAVNEARMLPSAQEKYPELLTERIWESIVKRLFQKEYKFDLAFYGSLNEYAKKIAYFFHASLQGCGAFPNAARTVRSIAAAGLVQGVYADAQCFSMAQLQEALKKQDESCTIDTLIPPAFRALSFDSKGRKPSPVFRDRFMGMLETRGLEPFEVLYVGNDMNRDIIPLKQLGVHTALYVGDRNSVVATADQLKDDATRPDLLLTDLSQLELLLG
jgi:hypothetical protein